MTKVIANSNRLCHLCLNRFQIAFFKINCSVFPDLRGRGSFSYPVLYTVRFAKGQTGRAELSV